MSTLELEPTTLVAGGDALARDADGRVVFVAGALPGERVRAEVVEHRRDFARARTLEMLEAAPLRVVPPCPNVARGCGGCDLQHADVVLQRHMKREIVADALRRLGGVDDPVVGEGPVLDPTGFRTSLRMGVTSAGRAAYRRAASTELLDVDRCLVAHPLVDELVAEGCFDGATEVVLRCGARTGDRLVLASPTAARVRVPDDVLVVGEDQLAKGRRAWFHEEAAGRRWRVSARSFFQTRTDGAEALVEVVREASRPVGASTAADAADAADDGPMVDAYGGVGLFSGTVGQGRKLTLLERSVDAVADARVNLSTSSRVLRLDVTRWRASKADVVVADPARSGLGPRGVRALAASGASRLVLVSCDAASLGRDTALLSRTGYVHAGSTLVDLFPGTSHVEVVTRFLRP